MATPTPLSVPSSTCSKRSRSRSRDSAPSSAASSRKGFSFMTPSFNISSENQSLQEPAASPPRPATPLGAAVPAFLRQSKSDISTKFVDLEWEQRKRLFLHSNAQSDDATQQWARVAGTEVTRRNRYANVDPYMNNRVKLNVPEGQNDYINASPILLRTSKSELDKHFIATQGPKEGSHSHIWRMIWDETSDPAVIIMLTQVYESGREKCFQYFPNSLEAPTLNINEHDEFEDGLTSTVTLLSLTEDPLTRSTVRELEIKSAGGETKKVWHLLFAGWPDFLVPEGEDRAALLALIQLSRDKCADQENPRIVHCSAGVGRSGTFIALDWLLAELDEGSLDEVPADQDPIMDVVDRLRAQRMMMVQGEAQFQFLYDVVRERWLERWTRRQSDPVDELTTPGNEP